MWVLLFGFLQSLWARFALWISAIVAIGMAILIAFLRGRSAGKQAYRRTHEKAQARAVERTRKRNELLAATEKKFEEIAAATKRPKRPLRGMDKIVMRVGRARNQYKMGKHFILDFGEDRFDYRRDEEKIAAEAALDGIYVVRTSLEAAALGASDTVRAYKDLSKVERAFRSLKTVDLKIRPIFHWLDGRIRAHVFLCMLAYYIEWHLRAKLAPVLFDDEERESAETARPSIVAPAPRSQTALNKEITKRTADGWPVHSFQTLLQDLATLTINFHRVPGGSNQEIFEIKTTPPPVPRPDVDPVS